MLLTLIIYLIVIGAVLYCVNLLPIDGNIKKIINVLVIVVVIIAVIQMLLGGGLILSDRLRL